MKIQQSNHFTRGDINTARKNLKNYKASWPEYLYDIYSAPLYGFIKQMMVEDKLAAEILEISFLKIWKNLQPVKVWEKNIFIGMMNIARDTVLEYKELEQSPTSHKFIKGSSLPIKPGNNDVIRELFIVRRYNAEQIAILLHIPLHIVKSTIHTLSK